MKHMSYPRVIALALLLLAAPAFTAELRTAAQDSAPKFVRHSDGTVSGISIDVMKAINRIDPTLRFVDHLQAGQLVEHGAVMHVATACAARQKLEALHIGRRADRERLGRRIERDEGLGLGFIGLAVGGARQKIDAEFDKIRAFRHGASQ